MSVSFAPGWGDELGSGLAGIAGGIKNIVDPNWKLKELLKQKMSADPSMVTELSNMYSSNPDAVKNMPGMSKDILAMLANSKPDAGYMAKQTLGKATTQQIEANPVDSGRVAAGLGTTDEASLLKSRAGAAEIDMNHKKMLQDQFASLPVGKQQEYLDDENFLSRMGMSKDQATKLKLDLADHERQTKYFDSADTWLNEHKDIAKSPSKLVDALLDENTEIDPYVAGAIVAKNPLIADLFNQKKQDLSYKHQLEMQTNALASREGIANKNDATKLKIAQDAEAFRSKTASKNNKIDFGAQLYKVQSGLRTNKLKPEDIAAEIPVLQRLLDKQWELDGKNGSAPTIVVRTGGGLMGSDKKFLGAKPIIGYSTDGGKTSTPITSAPDLLNGKGIEAPVIGNSDKINKAVQLLKSKTGTIEQLMSSTQYTDAEKAAIKKAIGGN